MSKLEDIVNGNIRRERESRGLSQEQVGAYLGMSRATYNGVENGKRPIAMDELAKLADYYGIRISTFFYAPRNDEKFKQMYFYVLKKFKDGLPKTKLAKMLYLADFSYFYDNLEPISGVNYIRRQYGPVADVFFELTDEMYDEGKLDIIPIDNALIIKATSEEGEDLLMTKEKKRLDEICEIWGKKRTAEIVEFSHSQKPWMTSRNGEVIPYISIIQEDPEHVYTPA